MIAENERKEVLTAIAQAQDEVAFHKIAAIVRELLTPVKAVETRAKAGFLQGSITYLAENWDAPLADTDWAHNSTEW